MTAFLAVVIAVVVITIACRVCITVERIKGVDQNTIVNRPVRTPRINSDGSTTP